MTAPAPLMRQPDKIVIVPSNPNPWYGAWEEGARFSGGQLAEMRRRGLDPETVETVLVHREAEDREMWWPMGSPPPVFEIECPLLNRRKDGKLTVIASGGWIKIVRGDGWAGWPSRENWLRFKQPFGVSAVRANSASASPLPASAGAEDGRRTPPAAQSGTR